MHKKFLSKEDIERAQKHTKSNKAAARFLGCSYSHYQMYAKLYKNDNGETLWYSHRNRGAEGVGRLGYNITKSRKFQYPLLDILNGTIPFNYSENLDILKYKLIFEGFLPECCNNCEFRERRVTDLKVPLILNFKDSNKKNWKLENLEFLCYNCYFLNVGNVFSEKELDALEDYGVTDYTREKIIPSLDIDKTITWEKKDKEKEKDDLDDIIFIRK